MKTSNSQLQTSGRPQAASGTVYCLDCEDWGACRGGRCGHCGGERVVSEREIEGRQNEEGRMKNAGAPLQEGRTYQRVDAKAWFRRMHEAADGA